ncbi:MAG: hypothetical protein ACTHK4_13250 [Mycobacteriales bacterium]
MLLVLALVLFVVFAVLGFTYHLMWFGLIVAVFVGVVDIVTRHAETGSAEMGKDALAGPSLRGEGLGEPDR